MSFLSALILGILQGLSEFIPISSTAHLTVAAALLGVIDPAHPERWTAFMAVIQLGTLAAVLLYFRLDISRSSMAWFAENVMSTRVRFSKQSADSRLGWFVIIGTIPIVIVGLLFKDVIEGALTKDLRLIGSSLIGVAILLWAAERRATFSRTISQLKVLDAIVVGMSQCLALIPGSSRSGSTIMAALFRGITREHAARFSFLLSIPAILAAGLLEFYHEAGNIRQAGEGLQLAIATVASFVSGYWSISFLIRYLRTHTLSVFIVYRIALGIALLFVACTPNQQKETDKPLTELSAPTEVKQDEPPEVVALPQPVATDTVVITTTSGKIVVELYGEDAPQTVKNFVSLVGKRYYDGIVFHRVAKDFVIQAGDPKTRDSGLRPEWGSGGQTASGMPLAEELDATLPSAKLGYRAGTIAMARTASKSSGTSQFFICLENAASLPYQYTIFGYVIDGLEVVKAIGNNEVEPGPFGEGDGIPRKSITIKNIRKT